jgi:hypothetical protein
MVMQGLRLRTMYDPSYRPGGPWGEAGGHVGASCEGVPLAELLADGRLEGRVSGRRAMRGAGGGVEVLRSVRASVDRPLAAAPRVALGGYEGPLRESMVVEGGAGGADSRQVQLRVLGWLQGLGVHTSRAWLPRCEAGANVARKSREGLRASRTAPQAPSLDAMEDDFSNGVLLAELAAALVKRGDAAGARASLRCLPNQNRFVLRGTCLKPRCLAQVCRSAKLRSST